MLQSVEFGVVAILEGAFGFLLSLSSLDFRSRMSMLLRCRAGGLRASVEVVD